MRLAALLALFSFAIADNLIPVDYIRNKFYPLETELWDNVTDPRWTESGLGDVELTKVFIAFDNNIQSIPTRTRPPLSTVWWWKKPLEQIQIVDGVYKNFIEFLSRQSAPGAVPSPIKEWMDLAENILVDSKTSVIRAIKRLEEALTHADLFRRVATDLQEEHPDLCELQMSQHQLIFDMYNTISLAEIKGYAMMQFSWMLLRIYGKGNFTQEASLTRQRYGQRTNQTAAAARAALSLAKRDLHRCDPAAHKEGVTYDMVKRLLQGYIENEVDMNSDGTCRENCAYYTVAENKNCYQDLFCKKQTRCGGRIIDCTFLESDMWVCQPNYRHDHRRYEWIKYESGRTLGHPDTCSGSVTKVDSWWKWNLLHCSYCFCLCEEDIHDNRTQRFFSLGESVADVENNKVVTGLRLVKYGRVFHLQISQGTLGERGLVTPGSWVEPENKFDPKDYEVNEGVDFHTLTYEKRAIDLDELDSPSGHVMTGARFRMIGAHLHFEIRSTPFNYTTGALSHQKSVWISNDNTDGTFTPRKKLELSAPDIPTRSGMSLPVDSQHDQYMEFTHTDMNKDAAQNTVPFIDIQPVEPLKGAALLSGAGIIHRGASGSGGFLAAKVITYDFSKHVQAELPSEENYHEDDTTDFVPVVN
ncbi:uncharacterized protein LOC106138026 isoform X4 [Amyelois transitella]|uniref:uncharacterized protein LOC106138026 isoform X4 n=1 Tax=Amyelois transitella TaxID=680683 RepID=UPI00067A7F18|nr:uncharacterized protein LOC106138026 isoform X4 [Amyelois transitella]